MPATTPAHQIPYPVAADKVSAYPATAKQAAEKIEQVFAALAAIPNLGFTSDASFETTLANVRAVGPVRIATLRIKRKASGGYQSGYHWRIGTVGTATERPKVRFFGSIMGKSDPYLYIEPNGEIHMQFWSAGTWDTGIWDGQIEWAVN